MKSTPRIHEFLGCHKEIFDMRICFNCKHKRVAINLDKNESHKGMIHAKDNIFVECLKGNSSKMAALYRDYSHLTVGSLENKEFECHEVSDVVLYMGHAVCV